MQDLISPHLAEFAAMLNDPVQWLAIAAAVAGGILLMWSGLVKTIIPMRWLAVGSNLGFVIYGAIHPAPLVFLLHLALLPINLWRVLEMQRLTRRVQQARSAEGLPHMVLQPYMKRQRMAAGRVLFKRGDPADRLYVLAEGVLEVQETGARIDPGQLVGEISFFAPDGVRTATVRCASACTLLSMDETAFRQLFHQNPSFGYEVVRLITQRLSADVQRLRTQRSQTDESANLG
jgi:CRP/FNR family transcriptional regulator, cyclic AMP receptor protein